MPGGRDPNLETIPQPVEELEVDIDYWTSRLGERPTGSDWEYWVETRLKKLDRVRLRLGSNQLQAGLARLKSTKCGARRLRRTDGAVHIHEMADGQMEFSSVYENKGVFRPQRLSCRSERPLRGNGR